MKRIEAFIKLGRPDPVDYADEKGGVSWYKVSNYVKKLLTEHSEKV